MSALGHLRPGWSEPHDRACPLRPESGQIADRFGMSALCQKRTYALQQKRICSITSARRALARANRDTHTHTHRASERRITRDGDAMHTPPLARIIVERAMLGAAVVPDRQRTNLPAESAGKLRLNGMRHQKIKNRPRLDALEPFERLRVIAYVERFAAGLRMGAHKRMRG